MPGKALQRSLFLILIVFFVLGVFRVFTIRFEKGDIYPPYSSYRSDPLGCKGFYDALDLTEYADVNRNVTPLHRLKNLDNTTVIITGLERWDFRESLPQAWFDSVDLLVRGGARLVFCQLPSDYALKKEPVKNEKTNVKPAGKTGKKEPKTKTATQLKSQMKTKAEKKKKDCCGEDLKNKDKKKPAGTGTKAKDGDKENDEAEEPYPVKQTRLTESWGFDEEYGDKAEGAAEPAGKYKKEYGLPGQPWHSSGYFTSFSREWKPVYTMNGKAVVLERPYGKGSIVLSTDSYFMSNEALRNGTNPRLLTFLTGDNVKVLFDESHFGIRSEPGIAGLVRHYGLEGFAGALALFCLLYVWKNAGYFVPPREDEEVKDASARDQATGLASLYKRHVRTQDLLSVCLSEWEKTAPQDKKAVMDDEERWTRIKTLATGCGEKTDPVAGYREIKRLMNEREKI